MTHPTLVNLALLVAEAAEAPAAGGDAAGAAEGAGQSGAFNAIPLTIMGAILLYFFMFIRPERQKAATLRTKLEGLKKNDRVVTIGGIYGVVMNVQRDTDEVTLKIDETTNAKIRVTFGAIARIVGDEPAAEKPA